MSSAVVRLLRGLKRATVKRLYSFPENVECNLCGWKGRRFLSDGWHPGTVCCGCGSLIRHRLMAAAFATLPQHSFDTLIRGKRVLHFAPEAALQPCLQAGAARYVTADLLQAELGRTLDISDMPSVGDGEFDVLVACDVLEHVADDRAALREIRRVLAPGGVALLTVPQKDHLETTLEDPRIQSPADREREYGQWDHVRLYGSDFVARLEAAAFRVSVVDEKSFPAALVKRSVLFPPVLSARPLATNYRKVFFAQKGA